MSGTRPVRFDGKDGGDHPEEPRASGEAATLACAAHGASVTCLDVNETAAADVARRARRRRRRLRRAALDMRDADAVIRAFEAIRARDGHLDVVIWTPSINVRKRILDYQPD